MTNAIFNFQSQAGAIPVFSRKCYDQVLFEEKDADVVTSPFPFLS